MHWNRPFASAIAAIGAAIVVSTTATAAAQPGSASGRTERWSEMARTEDLPAKTTSDVPLVASAELTARRAADREGALVVADRERPDKAGRNDELFQAQRLRGLGTSGRQARDAVIEGTLAEIDTPPTPVGPFAEDDGAIPLAHPVGLSAAVVSVVLDGAIGDGPHGTSGGDGTGDFDFFVVEGAVAGQVLTVDVDAFADGSGLDSIVAVTTLDGDILALNDDAPEPDSFLQLAIPADGDYIVAVAAFGALPTNPFDSASGTGSRTEGPYELTLSYDFLEDLDTYRVDLRAGDVLGVGVTGAPVIDIFDPFGTLVMSSGRNQTGFYPDASPLRMGGTSVAEHVAALDGPHFVRISRGDADYTADVLVRRPGLESDAPGTRQILYLDFDGAFIDPSTFQTNSGELSPMADFMAGWGLGPQDESALIDAVVAEFTENVVEDVTAAGGNPRFAVDIRNSRDDADPWGQPNVTRIVLGGTREQLDFNTVGVAESVDPGNFAREETGVVLLDQASAPAGSGVRTLNDFARPDDDMVALVGQTMGFIASHEAGHLLGEWHTRPNNGVVSIMDTFDVTQLGLGPDFDFGTADDDDVDFVTDELIEGFVGAEDTLQRVAWALSSPS